MRVPPRWVLGSGRSSLGHHGVTLVVVRLLCIRVELREWLKKKALWNATFLFRQVSLLCLFCQRGSSSLCHSPIKDMHQSPLLHYIILDIIWSCGGTVATTWATDFALVSPWATSLVDVVADECWCLLCACAAWELASAWEFEI